MNFLLFSEEFASRPTSCIKQNGTLQLSVQAKCIFDTAPRHHYILRKKMQVEHSGLCLFVCLPMFVGFLYKQVQQEHKVVVGFFWDDGGCNLRSSLFIS